MNNAKIQIYGNLTRDPATKDINGNSVVSFGVAVNTNAKNQDGTFKSDFYDVSVWGRLGSNLMQHLQKGSSVWVCGNLTTNEYVGRDGKPHTSLNVQADDVRGIDRLKTDAAQPAGQRKAQAPNRSYVSAAENTMPF